MSAIIEVTTAAKVLARMRAKAGVKDAIRRQGHKLSDYKAKEITSWAEVYLDEHPELIPEALANARAMILAGHLGKRAQRALRANLFGKVAETEHSSRDSDGNHRTIQQ